MLTSPGCPCPSSQGRGREEQVCPPAPPGAVGGLSVEGESPSEPWVVAEGADGRPDASLAQLGAFPVAASSPVRWHLLALRPWVGRGLNLIHSFHVGWEEEGRTPKPLCGNFSITLLWALEPSYLWESESDWPHLSMFSGPPSGMILLE